MAFFRKKHIIRQNINFNEIIWKSVTIWSSQLEDQRWKNQLNRTPGSIFTDFFANFWAIYQKKAKKMGKHICKNLTGCPMELNFYRWSYYCEDQMDTIFQVIPLTLLFWRIMRFCFKKNAIFAQSKVIRKNVCKKNRNLHKKDKKNFMWPKFIYQIYNSAHTDWVF